VARIQLDECVYQILDPVDVEVELAWNTLDAFVAELHVKAQIHKLVDAWNDQLCLELLQRPCDDVDAYMAEVNAQRDLIMKLHPMPRLRA
jgi:methionine synthase II (cobalamin-independent)